MAIKLGKLLIQHKILTAQQVNKALQAQQLFGGKLGTNMVELGFITDERLAEFLGQQLGMEATQHAWLENISPAVLNLVASNFAETHKMVPYRLDQKLHVAIGDPGDLAPLDELSFRTGKTIHPTIAPEIWIIAALERYYGIPRETRYVSISQDNESFVGEVTYAPELPPYIATTYEEEKEVDDDALIAPLAEYGKALVRTTSPEEVFNELFSFLGPFFPYIAVYAFRKKEFCGWLVRGFPLRTSEFVKTCAPLAPGVLQKVTQSKEIYRGEIPQGPSERKLFETLRLPPQQKVAIYPLTFQDRAIAIMLGVPGKDLRPPIPDAGKIISEAIYKAGLALEIIFLRRKVEKPSTKPHAAK